MKILKGVYPPLRVKAVMPHGEREHALQMPLRGWGCADDAKCGRPGNEMAGDELAEDYGQIYSWRWWELQCRGDGWRGKSYFDSERDAESYAQSTIIYGWHSIPFNECQCWIEIDATGCQQWRIISVQFSCLCWRITITQQHATLYSSLFLGENSVTPLGGVAAW